MGSGAKHTNHNAINDRDVQVNLFCFVIENIALKLTK